MKHLQILIIGLLLCFCSALQAKDRVIAYPPFCARNNTAIEVSKVVMSDTATVLHIYAKYPPKNWIKIAKESYLKDNNGRTYQLRSGIGITPDKELWMPETGEAEFQLVFPPLAENATAIEFTEGEGVEGGFSIWGILLKGKKLPELILPQEAVVHKVNKTTELPEELPLKYGKTTVKGKLLDYRGDMMKQIVLYPSEPIIGYENAIKADIQSDGSFATAFNVSGLTTVHTYAAGDRILFFVEPEQTTEVYLNLREASRKQSKFHKDSKPYGIVAYINGPLAGIAEEWNQINLKTSLTGNYDLLLKKAENMDVNSLKSYLLERTALRQQEINKQPVSNATKQLLTSENEQSLIEALQMVPDILTQAYLQKNKLENEAGKEYYMKLIKQIPEDYIPTSYYKNLNLPYTKLTPSYTSTINRSIYKKNKMPDIMGTDKGAFFDILNAAAIYKGIKDFQPLNDSIHLQMENLPLPYRQVLEQANNQLLLQIEANKKKSGFTVNKTGEVSNEDLFASIISKFRGKTLLVDFWATWCGPCRMANKQMVPMKEELKGKDIVYLYITGETSPLKTWENMIPDIHGEHFRVTAAQWKYLCESFKVDGIPTYLMIDRDGNIKYKETGFPGVDKIKEELLKITDK